MTPLQNDLLVAIQSADDWISAREISAIVNVEARNILKYMKSNVFNNLEHKMVLRPVYTRVKLVKAWRYIKDADAAHEAIKLSKNYPGMFGQLIWCTNGI